MSRILIHVDAGQSWPARLAMGLAITRNLGGGSVSGLFGPTQKTLPSYAGLMSRSIDGHKEQADEEAEIRKIFSARAADGMCPSDWLSPSPGSPHGTMTEYIIAQSRMHDLTIMGRPGNREDDPSTPIDMVEQIILNAGRPVLCVPPMGQTKGQFSRVLIAFNDSREAARAIHDAIPFIQGTEATVLIIRHGTNQDLFSPVTSFGDDASAGKELPAEDTNEGSPPDWQMDALATYLSDKGIKADIQAPVVSQRKIADVLLSQATDMAADLLVMGAFGKLGLPRMLRGSVTRDVLRNANLPVLLGH